MCVGLMSPLPSRLLGEAADRRTEGGCHSRM